MSFFDGGFFDGAFFDVAVSGTTARPTATIAPGAWTPSSGTDLHPMLDSEEPDDATYIVAAEPTISRLQLSAALLPALAARGLKYRASGTNGGLKVRLYQGNTMISERVHATLPASVTQYTISLDESELAALTDGSAMFVELEATA